MSGAMESTIALMNAASAGGDERPPDRGLLAQLEDGEPATGVGPKATDPPTCGARKFRKLLDGVFVGIFRVDALSGAEMEAFAQKFDHLLSNAHEMHFNPTSERIVYRLVTEGR